MLPIALKYIEYTLFLTVPVVCVSVVISSPALFEEVVVVLVIVEVEAEAEVEAGVIVVVVVVVVEFEVELAGRVVVVDDKVIELLFLPSFSIPSSSPILVGLSGLTAWPF